MKKIFFCFFLFLSFLISPTSHAQAIDEVVVTGSRDGTNYLTIDNISDRRYSESQTGTSGSAAPPPPPPPPAPPPRTTPSKAQCKADNITSTKNLSDAAAVQQVKDNNACDWYTNSGNAAMAAAPFIPNNYGRAAALASAVALLAKGSSCRNDATATYTKTINALTAAQAEWDATVCEKLQ